MNNAIDFNLAGWSAVLNGVTSIISTVTLLTFFAIGGPFGTINDGNSVLWALTFLPLALLFYGMHRDLNGALNAGTTVAGIAAMIIFAISQFLLTIGLVRFEQTFTLVLIMGGIIGIWLIVQGFLALGTHLLPTRLIWLMIAFGASFVLSMIGFLIGGWESPLAAGGFLIGAILGPIWAFWLARLLLRGTLYPATLS